MWISVGRGNRIDSYGWTRRENKTGGYKGIGIEKGGGKEYREGQIKLRAT